MQDEQADMDIPQEQVDQWRQFFEHLRVMAEEGQDALSADNTVRVRDILQDIHDHAVQIGLKMEDAGAQPSTPGVVDHEVWAKMP